MRQVVTCSYCGGEIRRYDEVFDHVTCEAPTGDMSPDAAKRLGWKIEKQLNRVQRTVDRWRWTG